MYCDGGVEVVLVWVLVSGVWHGGWVCEVA